MTENEKGYIYLITNITNGKKYIGQTKTTPEKRFNKHWSEANNKLKLKTKLHLAMLKYGKDNFTIETLCIVPKNSLDIMECYWAEQLETYTWDNNGGYNMVWCGSQPRLRIKQDPEVTEKITNKLKGRKQSEEQIKKARDAHIKILITNGKKDMKLNPEDIFEILNLCKNKISQTVIAKKFNVRDSVIVRILKGERWSHLTNIKPIIKEGPKRVKLGYDKAKEIFDLYMSRFGSYDKIKDLYKVNKTTVASIVKGKLYPQILKEFQNNKTD
jgi:group I intron endonuclease